MILYFSAKWNKRPSVEALRGWIVLIDEEAKVGSAYARQNKANKTKAKPITSKQKKQKQKKTKPIKTTQRPNTT